MRVRTSRSTLQISPKLARRLTGRRDLGGRQAGLGIVRLDRDSAPGGENLVRDRLVRWYCVAVVSLSGS
jgi:hypothetical protein